MLLTYYYVGTAEIKDNDCGCQKGESKTPVYIYVNQQRDVHHFMYSQNKGLKFLGSSAT
jgi:hypothetical protein